MWIAANQPRPAADGPQPDTNPAVTPDYTDDSAQPLAHHLAPLRLNCQGGGT